MCKNYNSILNSLSVFRGILWSIIRLGIAVFSKVSKQINQSSSHFENGRDIVTSLYMSASVSTAPFCRRVHIFSMNWQQHMCFCHPIVEVLSCLCSSTDHQALWAPQLQRARNDGRQRFVFLWLLWEKRHAPSSLFICQIRKKTVEKEEKGCRSTGCCD